MLKRMQEYATSASLGHSIQGEVAKSASCAGEALLALHLLEAITASSFGEDSVYFEATSTYVDPASRR